MKTHLDRLAHRLGEEALHWLLAADETTVEAWSRRPRAMPPGAQATLAALAELVAQEHIPRVHGRETTFIADELSRLHPESGQAYGAFLRGQSGGEIERAGSDDETAALLLALASELVPVHLLLPHQDLRPFAFIASHGITAGTQHPLAAAVNERLKEELPFDRWSKGDHGVVFRSTGASGQVVADHSATQILTDAGIRWMFSDAWPEATGFFAAVIESLEAFRAAIEGRDCHVPQVVGIGGLRIVSGARAALPWGTLRAPREHELRRLPENDATSILITTTRLQLASLKIGRSGPPAPGWSYSFESAQDRLRDTMFALLLADLVPPAQATWWRFTISTDPTVGSASFMKEERRHDEAYLDLDDEALRAVEHWASVFSERHDKSLNVAVRRAVAAVGRHELDDAIVDAVIGWENLFGSARGETVLRISAAFAHLLGDTEADRVAIARQVRKDYRLRSRLVHGSEVKLDRFTAVGDRDRVLRLLLRAMRKLYSDRPELVGRPSDERGQALIVGSDDG